MGKVGTVLSLDVPERGRLQSVLNQMQLIGMLNILNANRLVHMNTGTCRGGYISLPSPGNACNYHKDNGAWQHR